MYSEQDILDKILDDFSNPDENRFFMPYLHWEVLNTAIEEPVSAILYTTEPTRRFLVTVKELESD